MKSLTENANLLYLLGFRRIFAILRAPSIARKKQTPEMLILQRFWSFSFAQNARPEKDPRLSLMLKKLKSLVIKDFLGFANSFLVGALLLFLVHLLC